MYVKQLSVSMAQYASTDSLVLPNILCQKEEKFEA